MRGDSGMASVKDSPASTHHQECPNIGKNGWTQGSTVTLCQERRTLAAGR